MTVPEIPMLITAHDLELRPFKAGDGRALSKAVEESRIELARWQSIGEDDRTAVVSESGIEKLAAAFAARTRLQYAIFERGGLLLGGCALEHIDWTVPSFQLGYWLRTGMVGKGYATRAARMLTDVAFRDLNARRVAIWTDALNARSIAVAERLGFRLEGRLRNERLNTLGQPQDTVVFACVPNEWPAVRRSPSSIVKPAMKSFAALSGNKKPDYGRS